MLNKVVKQLSVATATVGLVTLGATFAHTQTADAAAIRSGFNSNTLLRNDDLSTSLVSIGFDINFGSFISDQLYVNNNGNVTFDQSLFTFTPFNLTNTTQQIIAPFFADVDTRGPGDPVTYGTGIVDGRDAFGANCINVAHYDESFPLNSFQLVLIDRSDTGAGNFDFEFNYNEILWESGEASGGNSQGLGGESARVGFSNGTGDPGTFFELPGSGVNGAFIDGGSSALVSNSLNSNVLGRYKFSVRDGKVVTSVPEPASILGLLALSALGTTFLKRKQNEKM